MRYARSTVCGLAVAAGVAVGLGAGTPATAPATRPATDAVPTTDPAPEADAGVEVQPDAVRVGTVYVGATVQASVFVIVPGDDRDVPVRVTAGPGVRVLEHATDVTTYGSKGSFERVAVYLRVDAAAAGPVSTTVDVAVGGKSARVPVTATVRPPRAGLTRVLVVGTPWERYSTTDGRLFDAWTKLVDREGLAASYVLVEPADVVARLPLPAPVTRDAYDAVLLPADGLRRLGDAPGRAADAVVGRIQQFARDGGRVVVTADHFNGSSVGFADRVLDGTGLRMRDVEGRGGDGRDEAGPDRIDPELARAGVRSARFFRGSPVERTNDGDAAVLVRGSHVPGPDGGAGYVGRARVGKGQVVAIGQSLWWDWIAADEARNGGDPGDNARLLGWALTGR